MTEQFVDEVVAVQARFSTDGRIQPVAFIWRGRTCYLAGLGRRWKESAADGDWRCFLAQTAGGDTVELRWQQETHVWRLRRIWQRAGLA